MGGGIYTQESSGTNRQKKKKNENNIWKLKPPETRTYQRETIVIMVHNIAIDLKEVFPPDSDCEKNSYLSNGV